jgi:trimeric autotransporter adhesin
MSDYVLRVAIIIRRLLKLTNKNTSMIYRAVSQVKTTIPRTACRQTYFGFTRPRTIARAIRSTAGVAIAAAALYVAEAAGAGVDSVELGTASAPGDAAAAIGAQAAASGNSSLAVGSQSNAQNDGAIRATNRYTDDQIRSARRDSYGGAASALAIAGLPQAVLPGHGMVAMAGGTYGGQSALAISGSQLSDTGKWIYKVQGSTDSRRQFGASIGAGMHW